MEGPIIFMGKGDVTEHSRPPRGQNLLQRRGILITQRQSGQIHLPMDSKVTETITPSIQPVINPLVVLSSLAIFIAAGQS